MNSPFGDHGDDRLTSNDGGDGGGALAMSDSDRRTVVTGSARPTFTSGRRLDEG